MEKIKRAFFSILICCIVCVSAATAQDKQTRFEKIEAAKVAYVTKELALTPQEAQQFFPVYNEYQKELRAILHRKRSENAEREKSKPRPKRGELDYDTDVLNLRKQYRKKFSGIVGDDRSSRYFEVERQFREQLYDQLKERRSKGKP